MTKTLNDVDRHRRARPRTRMNARASESDEKENEYGNVRARKRAIERRTSRAKGVARREKEDGEDERAWFRRCRVYDDGVGRMARDARARFY